MSLWPAYQWRSDCKTCFYSKQYVAPQDLTGLLSKRIPKVMTSRRKWLWESLFANLMGGCNTEVYTKNVITTILHFFMKVAHTSLFTLHLRYKLWFDIRWWKMTYNQADFVWKLQISKITEGTQVVTSLSPA